GVGAVAGDEDERHAAPGERVGYGIDRLAPEIHVEYGGVDPVLLGRGPRRRRRRGLSLRLALVARARGMDIGARDRQGAAQALGKPVERHAAAKLALDAGGDGLGAEALPR